jgi:hypothetical protein
MRNILCILRRLRIPRKSIADIRNFASRPVLIQIKPPSSPAAYSCE